MLYREYIDFLPSLNDLHIKGQNFGSAAKKAMEILIRSRKHSDPKLVFSGIKQTNHGEKRINHVVKYDIGRACRLVTYQNKNICVFLFAGDHTATDHWLDKNRGLEIGINSEDNSLTTIYKSSNREKQQIPNSGYSPQSFSLVNELSQTHKNLLLDPLKFSTVEQIQTLNSMSSDDDIEKAIIEVTDDRYFDVLVDVLTLLREKTNFNKVMQRIQAFEGEIITLNDASEKQIESADFSGEITEINLSEPGSEEFIENALRSKDFKSWMLFMHPNQKYLAEKNFNTPVLLRGVSGSGKTAIVVNRAIYLSKKYPKEQIAVFTLNKSLAKLIQNLINTVVGNKSNIKVMDFWQECKDILKEFEPNLDKHFDEITWKSKEDITDNWMEFYHQETENYSDVMFPVHQSLLQQGLYPEEYIKEEFDFIRSALSAGKSREEYLSMKREGRSIPLNVEYRKKILQGLEAWEKKMIDVGSHDYVGVTSRAYQHIEKITSKYHSILIDEMQDFGTLELSIVNKLAHQGDNNLFFAGDLVQRVHTKQHNFEAAGINIPKDKLFEIKQNYRNSKEILEGANFILEDNLTGSNFDIASIDVLEPTYAQSSGYLPYILEGSSINEELTSAVQYLQEKIKEEPNRHINGCIAVCGYSLCELSKLADKLKVQLLDSNINISEKSIFISDLEQTKGFEFDHMIILNCSQKVLPNPNLPSEEAFRDLSRLYIAMTRARMNLVISYHGEISYFLQNASSFFVEDKWSMQLLINEVVQIKAPRPVRNSERFLLNSIEYENKDEYGKLSGKELLLTRRARGMSKNRQDRLLTYITGKNKDSTIVKNRTWRCLNDLFNEPNIVLNSIIAGNSDVASEKAYFENLFNINFKEKNTINDAEPDYEYESTDNKLEDFEDDWIVEVDNKYTLGVCMHCGRNAIPGEYVCYSCNPG